MEDPQFKTSYQGGGGDGMAGMLKTLKWVVDLIDRLPPSERRAKALEVLRGADFGVLDEVAAIRERLKRIAE